MDHISSVVGAALWRCSRISSGGPSECSAAPTTLFYVGTLCELCRNSTTNSQHSAVIIGLSSLADDKKVSCHIPGLNGRPFDA